MHYGQDIDHSFKKFGNKGKQKGGVVEAFREDMDLGENWAMSSEGYVEDTGEGGVN